MGGGFKVSDSTNDPEQRAWAVHLLIETLHFYMRDTLRGGITRLKAAPGVKERLVSTLRSEYDLLSTKFADVSYVSKPEFRRARMEIENYEKELKGSRSP